MAETEQSLNDQFQDAFVKKEDESINENQNSVIIEPVTPVVPTSVKIIKKKITGYVGFANLPKQWHRKSIRRGFSLNLLVVGQRGLGKSTLVNTLFNKDLYAGTPVEPEVKEETDGETVVPGVKIEVVNSEIEENGVTLRLSVVDTPGFGDHIDNTESWKPIVDEINHRFDLYLDAENKIQRGVLQDSRIHACVYFIEPTGHSLRAIDLDFFKQVHKKVNLVPVIAKSDILTDEEIQEFKQRILNDLRANEIDIFQPPTYDNDDEETVANAQALFGKMPFAVVGSTTEVKTAEGVVRGREYPWGVIDVDNEKHSDFVKLRELLVRTNLEDLRERTDIVLYEKYRSEKLEKLGIKQDNSVFREFDPETRQQEEKKLHEAKLAKLEAEMKAVFQQKVNEKEKKLQKSEAELFARHKEMKEKLMKQLKTLEEKKAQLEQGHRQEPASAVTKKKGFLR